MKDKSLLREVKKSKYKDSIKIGEVFGYWQVLDDTLYTVTYNHGGAIWVECKCTGCGEETQFVPYRSLISAGTNNSGGCLSCAGIRNTPRGNKSHRWQGVGEIPKSYINNISSAARTRGIDFEVSGEYIWELFLQQSRKCKLSGVELYFTSGGRGSTASLDRIDRTKPYIEGNVQWVHKIVNEMKWDKTDGEFIEWCKIVAEYNK